MIQVAMISRWHVHANDYARQAMGNPLLQIHSVWDEQPNRGAEWATELGVPFYADLAGLLADPALDAVIVDTPTRLHRDVIIQAARAGKHIYTEKVMGLTTQECEEMFAEIDAAGVKFMISLPRLSDPYYLMAQQVVDEGLLGNLTSIRCRLAHNGAVASEERPHGWLPAHFYDPLDCGGGALIDLGAHPIYLTNRLAGSARTVSARFAHTAGHAVEDTAAVIVEYASGALGILEAGFMAGGSPFQLEIHGTHGSLLVEDTVVRVRSDRASVQGWYSPELPAATPSPMQQWAACIASGTAPDITREDALQLTRINEAAALSNREGIRVTL